MRKKYDPQLIKSNKIIDGQYAYFHNGISLNEWKRSSKVDTLMKLIVRFTEIYLLAASKGVELEDRIYIQNPSLSTEKNENDILYQIGIRQTQELLTKLYELGVIRYFLYLDKDGNKYKYRPDKDKWDDLRGLTKRRIVLNLSRAKELLSITPFDKEYINAKPQGTLRRAVMRRPFTLVDLIDVNLINNQVVSDIREDKSKVRAIMNQFIIAQEKKFHNFTVVESDTPVFDETKDMIFNISQYIYYDVDDGDSRVNIKTM